MSLCCILHRTAAEPRHPFLMDVSWWFQADNAPVGLGHVCRVATCCLLCLLSTVYPSAVLLFQLLLMLDIFSHWFQMYAASLSGVTHKVLQPATAATSA